MKKREQISIFWFRRDLRLEDNHGLHQALKSSYPVLPIFIFDNNILDELNGDDPRVNFIYTLLNKISESLSKFSSGLYIKKGFPIKIWEEILTEYDVREVYTNEDYEPYSISRDTAIKDLLIKRNISFHTFKDQVIFSKNEICKNDNSPYTVYTPYKNKWINEFQFSELKNYNLPNTPNFYKNAFLFPRLKDLGFEHSTIAVEPYNFKKLAEYAEKRDYPALENTSKLGPHLRFGSISIRKVIAEAKPFSGFLNEMIWREFFMQILYHFPSAVDNNFKSKYDGITWRNNTEEFEKWKNGKTGFLLVDAGMRELNTSGYMHNRVRMVVAGFLCKHLLIDWRWGEAYFAKKLLDYELASNNGNWQWAAGTGCDAAPYFRVFNPLTQLEKFDTKLEYVNKWIPEEELADYYEPMVEHKFARERAINAYKQGIK